MQMNAIGVVAALMAGLVIPSALPYAARDISHPASIPESVYIPVPFFTQAPTGQWNDVRQKQGCEEASALMAIAWARDETFTAKGAAAIIVDASNYEEKQYGDYVDTSAADTAERIFKEYFNYQNVSVAYNVSANDIEQALADGSLVIVPIDGSKIGNQWYKQQPGPPRHMLLIHGYDRATGTFIMNDPGTERGADYRIPETTLMAALRDYPSSVYDTGMSTPHQTAMIIVSKDS